MVDVGRDQVEAAFGQGVQQAGRVLTARVGNDQLVARRQQVGQTSSGMPQAVSNSAARSHQSSVVSRQSARD
jgi:hypothetical protein